MRTSLVTSGMALAAIAIAILCSSCIQQIRPDGTVVRKVDPEARKFWGGIAVRAIILSDK